MLKLLGRSRYRAGPHSLLDAVEARTLVGDDAGEDVEPADRALGLAVAEVRHLSRTRSSKGTM
jgi:hypothetical protein